jgi:hypothetical protein
MDNFQLVDVSPDIPHSNIRKKLKSASHWTMTQKDKKNLDLLEDMEMALFMEELENGGPSSSKGLERSISLPTVKSPLTILSTKVSPIQSHDTSPVKLPSASSCNKENEGPLKKKAIGDLVKPASDHFFSDDDVDDFLFDPQMEEALKLAEV